MNAESRPWAVSFKTQNVPIRSYRDLIVWQKAMNLAVLVFRLTTRFPSSELCSLVAQLKRSASSVAANIADGRGRHTTKDFAHFVAVARGSLMETETFLLLAIRLEYLTNEQAKPALGLTMEIRKMLTALKARLKEVSSE
jgi:four helix bundle protein